MTPETPPQQCQECGYWVDFTIPDADGVCMCRGKKWHIRNATPDEEIEFDLIDREKTP